MADIFISYSREDQEKAGQLAAALEAKGWTVFWDQDIPPGKTWREYIGANLNAARCVIVAWSKSSVESYWVLEEADEGKKREILVPVLFDEIEPPLGFRSIQTGNLLNWKGKPDSTILNELTNAVSGVIGAPIKKTSDSERSLANRSKKLSLKKSTILLAVGALTLLLVSGWYAWEQSNVASQRTDLPPITQTQGEQEAPTSQKSAIDQMRMVNQKGTLGNLCTKPDPPIECLFR